MRTVTSAILVALFVSTLLAQLATTADLSGTIRDAAGTPVPGAVVTLTRSAIARHTSVTDHRGEFTFRQIASGPYTLSVEAPGFATATRSVQAGMNPDVRLTVVLQPQNANQVAEQKGDRRLEGGVAGGVGGGTVGGVQEALAAPRVRTDASSPASSPWMHSARVVQPFNTETYDRIHENGFRRVADHPLSTFSVDVDTASYSNIRRFLNDGLLPPADAVRTEELLNYFRFDYPQPDDGRPFSVTTELAACPWNQSHRLALIGLQGRRVPDAKMPRRNLVFLLDVSGSMTPANKLPLVKTAMRMLVDTLTENDRVAIVVYAGASGIVLPATAGGEKAVIQQALESLSAGGSTNGAAGIHAAYDLASSSFIKEGINRVILATDGDFNVGVTSQGELIRLIEEKRATGIFLSVLGVGEGNLKDSTMEKLADSGNGNYAYLDSLHEAKRVLIEEAGGTLVTIAKDVKLQIEFNPRVASAYRLIGYENRVLQNEDFNNDKKDAGEIGAGHTVTALYEIVPPGGSLDGSGTVDSLKYQEGARPSGAATPGELMTLKLRYKDPDGDTSRLMTIPVANRETRAPRHLGFAAAVAEFGMVLRRSEHRGHAGYRQVLELARTNRGDDPRGYRAEFIRLVELAAALDAGKSPLSEKPLTR